MVDISFLQIEPTTRCNFTCGFCAGRHMPQANMAVERLEEVLRAVGEPGKPNTSHQSDTRAPTPSPRPSPVEGEGEEPSTFNLRHPSERRGVRSLQHVELQGEGEPMLHPRFFEMAAMIRRMQPQAKISLITNGSLLSEENVARIIEIGFHKISVSIESPDEGAFAEIRGGKLEKVLEGVRRLLAARQCTPHAPREDRHHAERDEYTREEAPSPRPSPIRGEGAPAWAEAHATGASGSRPQFPKRHGGTFPTDADPTRQTQRAYDIGPAVGLAVTVLRRTMHELPRILELYESLGLDGGITIQPLQTMRSYTRHYGPDMQAQVLTPIDRWHLGEQMQHHPRLRAFFSRRPAVAGFYDELFAGWNPASGECPWLARGLYVAYDGLTTGCCFIKDTARDGFGELTPATAGQVLQRREAMQSELRDGRIPGPCTDCPVAAQIVARRRMGAFPTRGWQHRRLSL